MTESQDNRNLALACHLAGLLGTLLMGIGNVILPLIIWLLRRESSALVDDQGKEVLNFQITLWIVYVILGSLAAITLPLFGLGLIFFPIIFGVFVFEIVVSIKGAFQAQEGRYFRYPFCIRFLK